MSNVENISTLPQDFPAKKAAVAAVVITTVIVGSVLVMRSKLKKSYAEELVSVSD